MDKKSIHYPLKSVIRVSTKKDYTNHLNNIKDAKNAYKKCNELIKKYNLTHISTGEMFRNAIANKTPLGKQANEYISKGELVPDEVTIGLVKERLAQEDCKNGFILDGFPRTLYQAKCLDQICLELNTTMCLVTN